MCPALNYGQQAFEGLKAFRNPDGAINIFRPWRNASRLAHSATVLAMPPVPEEIFVQAVRAAVARNAEFVPPHHTGAALYIRPLLFGSSAQLGLSPPDEYMFCVFVVPTGTYHGAQPVRALVLDQFDRAAPLGVGHAKAGGNYAPVLRWSDAARQQGFGITLHLDSRRHEEIDEFSTSGFVGVRRDGNVVTLVVPKSAAVIDSVTSDSVQELARSFGWTVERRAVSLDIFQKTGNIFIYISNATRLNTPNCPSSPRSWPPAQLRRWCQSGPSRGAATPPPRQAGARRR